MVEVAVARGLCSYKEKVVVVVGVEVACAPAIAAAGITAQTELIRTADDLLQRRIADKGVVQRAREVRVGATKLRGGWCAARLAVVEVDI